MKTLLNLDPDSQKLAPFLQCTADGRGHYADGYTAHQKFVYQSQPCIATNPNDTTYKMYDKIGSAVKHTLFHKVKFYHDIDDANVFVG